MPYGHDLQARMRIGQYVVMAQHHAFGRAGRARRINDRCERGGVARDVARLAALVGQPLRDRIHPHVCVRVIRRLYDEDAHQATEFPAYLGKFLPLLIRAKQQHPALRIIQDVGNVVRTVLGIERHHDQAESQRRLVEYHPFRRVAKHDGDAVS